jgi:hyperosmotically inducible periplasmic protein
MEVFMRLNNRVLKAFIAGTIFMSSVGFAQVPAADNTKTNQGDGKPGAATADQQMSKSDLETARQIRESVYKDKTLSTYAHNVKILVQDGTVTLKGPVRSDEEKTSVFQKATAVAGDGKVVNELQVATK